MQASRQSSPAQGDCRDAFFAFLGKFVSLAADKVKYGSVQGASGKPPCRVRRREIPCNEKDQHRSRLSMLVGRAHLARQSASGRMSSLGARLRTREVSGRDASLPAPLLATFLELVARGTVGALPQTPQGTPSLDPARGNCPLTPPRDWVGHTFMLLLRAVFGGFA